MQLINQHHTGPTQLHLSQIQSAVENYHGSLDTVPQKEAEIWAYQLLLVFMSS